MSRNIESRKVTTHTHITLIFYICVNQQIWTVLLLIKTLVILISKGTINVLT